MRRIHLIVEYDGTDYAGWQRQSNAMTVQEKLENAVKKLTGETLCVHGASRTDAGVHALGQAVHFDTESRIPPEKYPFVLNTMLPRDVRVHSGREVPEGFHARFMTCGKRYTYRIVNSRHASAIRRNVGKGMTENLEVNAFSIGDLGFTTGTYEMSSTEGIYVRANSPFENTFILCGNQAYIPTSKAYDMRTYEGDTAPYLQGTAEAMADKYLEMLREIK